MKKISALLVMSLLFMSFALATDVRVDWDGSGVVNAEMEKDNSRASISGFGNTISGEFEADDDNYDRIEITNVNAEYTDGRYQVEQEATLNSGSETRLMAWSDSYGSGFVDIITDVWRTGNSLKTNGYGGHSWSWSGTDEQLLGATGMYDVGIYAGSDDDNDDTDDRFFGLNINGDGDVGIGTSRAGSNTVLSASSISGDLIVRGSGDSNWIQEFKGTNRIDGVFEWN